LALCIVSSAAEKPNVHIPVARHDFAFGWSYCKPEATSVMSMATGGQPKLMTSGYVGSGSKSETRHAEPTYALPSEAARQQRDTAQYLPRAAAGTLTCPTSTILVCLLNCPKSGFVLMQYCCGEGLADVGMHNASGLPCILSWTRWLCMRHHLFEVFDFVIKHVMSMYTGD
jgi:hypothetical protein